MLHLIKSYEGILCIISALFAILSKSIFERIYLTSKIVVDEEFHLPLGQVYCNYQFDKWHPKVTTLPGLYLISAVFLGPFDLCSTYWLRSVSLVASVINIFLFYIFLNLYNKNSLWKNVGSAINLALLPPLYFFSHLYYTDVISLTMILLLVIWALSGNHYLASISGLFAILIRQTNVIWVGMTFAYFVMKEFYKISFNKSVKRSLIKIPAKKLKIFWKNIASRQLFKIIRGASLYFWLNAMCYGSVLFTFLLFIYLNGGIVVGDKVAHETTIHIPQIFYYLLFTLFFAWPHFVTEIMHFFKFANNHKKYVLVCLILSFIIVYYNTLQHPYLLADNRHYIFYVWNRFYGKYFWFRYLMIPVYLFALYVYILKIWHEEDISFAFWFIPCSVIVLITQKLIEFRYFFVPFVLFRLQLTHISTKQIIFEFITYTLLNFITFYLFFNKTFEWDDFDYPQRLIW